MRRRTLLTALIPFAAAPLFVLWRSGSKPAQGQPVPTPNRRVSAVRDAEWIVVAGVVHIGISPGLWSDRFATRQHVTYGVEKTLVGDGDVEELTLGHMLVWGSSLVSLRRPELRADVFQPYARLVLHLRWGRFRWNLTDSEFGACRL